MPTWDYAELLWYPYDEKFTWYEPGKEPRAGSASGLQELRTAGEAGWEVAGYCLGSRGESKALLRRRLG
jgi:hypothetical protein